LLFAAEEKQNKRTDLHFISLWLINKQLLLYMQYYKGSNSTLNNALQRTNSQYDGWYCYCIWQELQVTHVT